MSELRRLTAARYAVPLREGGSLPGLIEADDHRLYVAKFHAAGQGPRALIAEVIAGELARAAGLPMPALVVLALAPGFGATEGDPEVHDLLAASTGDNLGIEFLSGAFGFEPGDGVRVAPALASQIVAFDVLVSNVDRTARNPNLLWVDGALWLIDHGAALYWHHAWDGGIAGADAPLPRIRDHVLWSAAHGLADAGRALAAALDPAAIAAAVDAVPDAWLGVPEPAVRRREYADRLIARRGALVGLLEEADRDR
jgi:hypothetical protein